MKNYARAAAHAGARAAARRSGTTQGNEPISTSPRASRSARSATAIPHWVAAVQRQAGELIHASNLFRQPEPGRAGAAARRLRRARAGSSSATAAPKPNEALIKLARLHGMRKSGEEGKCFKIICAKNAFHGRMFGGMSATPQEKIQKGFRPLVPGFVFGELNNLQSFADLVDDHTAAIFVETIQGESGINPCTPEFLRGCASSATSTTCCSCSTKCSAASAAPARSTPSSTPGVRPDAIGMAKGLGGGFPIGAIWVGETLRRPLSAGLARHDLWRHAARLRGGAGGAGRHRAGAAPRARHQRRAGSGSSRWRSWPRNSPSTSPASGASASWSASR